MICYCTIINLFYCQIVGIGFWIFVMIFWCRIVSSNILPLLYHLISVNPSFSLIRSKTFSIQSSTFNYASVSSRTDCRIWEQTTDAWYNSENWIELNISIIIVPFSSWNPQLLISKLWSIMAYVFVYDKKALHIQIL